MGVRRSHYSDFAGWLADQGYTVVIFDYRGIHESKAAPGSGSILRMQDWGELDTDAVLGHALQHASGTPVFLLGHSCGGQLFGLAKNSEQLSGVIFTGCQLGDRRLWPLSGRLALFLAWSILLPLFSLGREYFPAKRLRLSAIDVPTGVIRQWANWGRRNDYLFNDRFGLDTSRYREFSFPALACGVSDDRFAPRAAMEGLLAKMPRTRVQRWYLDTKEIGKVGHFGYFRSRMQDSIWTGMLKWLNEQTA